MTSLLEIYAQKLKMFSTFFQGHTFSKLINDHVGKYRPLNDTYLMLYETIEGRKVYDEILACVKKQFPQYIREIQGTADGAGIPFHKVMLIFILKILKHKIKSRGVANLSNMEEGACNFAKNADSYEKYTDYIILFSTSQYFFFRRSNLR